MGFVKSKVDLSVIMPVYNEEGVIANSIVKTLEVLDSANLSYELVVVDDGSQDNTVKVLEHFKDRAIILTYKENKGKGYALRYGASQAHGDTIAFFDSDLNIDPTHILVYFSYLQVNDVDALIGSKRLKGSEVKTSFERRLLSLIYHLFVKALLGLELMDSQVGIKMFKKTVLDQILPALTINRFAFDVEILAIASRLKQKIVELPVSIHTSVAYSSVSLRAIEEMFIDTFKIAYKLRIAKGP